MLNQIQRDYLYTLRRDSLFKEALVALLDDLVEGSKKDVLAIRLDNPDLEASLLYAKLRLEGIQDLARRIKEELVLIRSSS